MDGFPTHVPSIRRFSCRTALVLGISLSILCLGIGCGDFTLFGDEDQGICDPDPCADTDNAKADTCEDLGDDDYTCDCDPGYFWEAAENTCEDPCDPDPCEDIQNAEADTCDGVGVDNYICDCDDGYFWKDDGNTCVNPCDPDPCDGIEDAEPETCTGVAWDDFECECNGDLVWDGATNSCEVDPCEPDPCEGLENAVDGTCTAVGGGDYTCNCESGHAWDGATNTCEADPCDSDPCEELENAVAGTCEAVGTEDFTCDCGTGFAWNPQIDQCEITALGALQSGPYEFTVVTANDGILGGLLLGVLSPGTTLEGTVDVPSLDEVPVTRTFPLSPVGVSFGELVVDITQENEEDDFYTLTGTGTASAASLCEMRVDCGGEMLPESTDTVSVSLTLFNPVFTGLACNSVQTNTEGTIELTLSGELLQAE